MCQAFEGEQRSMMRKEMGDLRKKWRDHEEGRHILTEEEQKQIAVQYIMLRDAM